MLTLDFFGYLIDLLKPVHDGRYNLRTERIGAGDAGLLLRRGAVQLLRIFPLQFVQNGFGRLPFAGIKDAGSFFGVAAAEQKEIVAGPALTVYELIPVFREVTDEIRMVLIVETVLIAGGGSLLLIRFPDSLNGGLPCCQPTRADMARISRYSSISETFQSLLAYS